MGKQRQLLFICLSLFGVVSVTQPVWAEKTAAIKNLSQFEKPATTVKDWLSQTPQTLIAVTGVKANPTDKGVEVILQTSLGQQLQVQNRSNGNNFIVDIPNAQLRLPSGEAFTFRSTKPITGITEITVTNFHANPIRVTVIGEAALPVVELYDGDEGLIFAVASAGSGTQPQPQPQPQKPQTQTQPSQPSAEGDEPIELVVTGEQDGYNVPDASTATRTDTPIRDIPQSIQVIPRQVIEDQGVTRIEDAARNVSGVTPGSDFSYGGEFYQIRGFVNQRNLRNGFRTGTNGGSTGTFTAPSNIERVEVLKGPASVLYGEFEPGGIVNYVTKKPLNNPYYAAEFTAGSYSFYQPSIDLSGPLTADKRLLYRLNTSYQSSGSFVDFVNEENVSIAPVISYRFSDATTVTFEYQYSHYDRTYYEGLPADPIVFKIPISRNFGESGDRTRSTTNSLNFSLEHRFNDNLSLRSALGSYFVDGSIVTFRPRVFAFDPETNTVPRIYRRTSDYRSDFNWQTDLIAKFNTGSVQHQLLLGLELFNGKRGYGGPDDVGVSPINIFNPVYGIPIPPAPNTGDGADLSLNTVGVYLQDQVTLLPNLKLLLGGRYDFSRGKSQNFTTIDGEVSRDPATNFYDEAFSPRVGIVYQPIEPLSLYASYSRSFVPNNFTDRDGNLISPTRGTQYEVGIKAEFGKLAATLAAYEITKTNILTFDPIDFENVRAIGEVKSRGIEFDIGGEILPGWNVIASAFLNESMITVGDEFSPKGDILAGAPGHGASLWTSYKIQQGALQGLGFGVGVFYVGDVEAELPNDFVSPSYVRGDASIFYRRDNWNVGLNFKNLFNTRYYENSGATLSTIYPGAPFTVLGTVSVRF